MSPATKQVASIEPEYCMLAHNIRRLREARMSQQELADIVGLRPTYISHIERGIRRPMLHHIMHIARALNCSLLELVN